MSETVDEFQLGTPGEFETYIERKLLHPCNVGDYSKNFKWCTEVLQILNRKRASNTYKEIILNKIEDDVVQLRNMMIRPRKKRSREVFEEPISEPIEEPTDEPIIEPSSDNSETEEENSSIDLWRDCSFNIRIRDEEIKERISHLYNLICVKQKISPNISDTIRLVGPNIVVLDTNNIFPLHKSHRRSDVICVDKAFFKHCLDKPLDLIPTRVEEIPDRFIISPIPYVSTPKIHDISMNKSIAITDCMIKIFFKKTSHSWEARRLLRICGFYMNSLGNHLVKRTYNIIIGDTSPLPVPYSSYNKLISRDYKSIFVNTNFIYWIKNLHDNGCEIPNVDQIPKKYWLWDTEMDISQMIQKDKKPRLPKCDLLNFS